MQMQWLRETSTTADDEPSALFAGISARLCTTASVAG
jgi:hypothetical protein